MKRFILSLLMVVILLPQFVFSQEVLECLGTDLFWGECSEIEKNGNYIFVASGEGGIRIVDVSNPSELLELTRPIEITGIVSIAIENDYLYCLGQGNLFIVDISNPYTPEIVYTTPCTASKVEVHDEIMLLGYSSYMTLMDVSDVTNPEQSGTIDWGYGDNLQFVQDNYVYLNAGISGIKIIDINDPSQPSIINTFLRGYYAQNIYVENDRLYVTSYTTQRNGKVYLFDISDPEDPEQLSVMQFDNLHNIQHSVIAKNGDFLYLFTNNDIERDEEEENGILVVDVSDDQNPEFVGFFIDDFLKRGVEVINNYMFVNYLYYGLKSFEIENQALPTVMDWVGLDRVPSDFKIVNDKVITSCPKPGSWWDPGVGTISILSVEQPESMYTVTSIPGLDGYGDLAIRNNYAYVCSEDVSGIYIYDISDQNHLELVGNFDEGFSTRDIVIHANIMLFSKYQADVFQGTVIYDLTNPLNPVQLYAFSDAWIYDFEFPYLFASFSVDEYENVIRCLDISDPQSPVELSEVCAGSGYVRSVTNHVLLDDYFIVDGYEGYDTSYDFYEIYDISDPANPFQVIREWQRGYLPVYYGSDHYLLGPQQGHTLAIYDASDPVSPQLAYTWDYELFNGNIWEPSGALIRIYDGRIYFLSGNRMAILDGSHIFESGRGEYPDIFIPRNFEILNAYPNPFNPTVNVGISLPQAGDLKVQVYNINGQLVETLTDGRYTAGEHNLIFNGNGLSSGVYFINAVVPGEMNQTRKVTLVK